MLNWIKTNLQISVAILLIGVIVFQYMFLSNSYKKEYQKLIKQQEQSYIHKIDSLHKSNDSLLYSNTLIKHRIAEIDKSVSKKEAELVKLRKQNAQNSAKLNAMSDAELSSAFTELFN